MQREDNHIVIGMDISRVMPPPTTPEEILAAKKYLRGAFAEAAKRIETFRASLQDMPARERDKVSSPDDPAENTREIIARAAREVTAGTLAGEEILDIVVRRWQMEGDPPSFLRNQQKL